jgi:hypothetical protein
MSFHKAVRFRWTSIRLDEFALAVPSFTPVINATITPEPLARSHLTAYAYQTKKKPQSSQQKLPTRRTQSSSQQKQPTRHWERCMHFVCTHAHNKSQKKTWFLVQIAIFRGCLMRLSIRHSDPIMIQWILTGQRRVFKKYTWEYIRIVESYCLWKLEYISVPILGWHLFSFYEQIQREAKEPITSSCPVHNTNRSIVKRWCKRLLPKWAHKVPPPFLIISIPIWCHKRV